MSKFGLLGKIFILQDILSELISRLNPAVYHNINKYLAIKKAFYLSSIEEIKGDYFEFGVFNGSSFSHAVRCAKNSEKFDPDFKKMIFFGFDSFAGFGEVDNFDKHKFYTDVNFKTDYEKVLNRIRKIIPNDRFRLIKGFFKDSLKLELKTNLARIIFIDCDTYSSTKLALNFIRLKIQLGTIILLDDYFSYKGIEGRGVSGAFKNFLLENNIKTRTIFTYGMGGVGKIFVKI